MRYSFYQSFGEVNVFRLYLQRLDDSVECYEFKSNIKGISDEPGITRLFGKRVLDIAGNYFLFPIDVDNVEVGDFNVLEFNEKFIRIEFLGENILQGVWIIRLLNNGEWLLWKPFPVVTVMSRNVEVIDDDENDNRNEEFEIKQNFSIFETTIDGNHFEGIAIAEGIWTGEDLNTTLFNERIIKSLGKDMKKNLNEQLVDFDHSFVKEGRLTFAENRQQNSLHYVYVKGVTERRIPFGSGLSLIVKSTIKWNDNLNVFTIVRAQPLGVSIITESAPACTICMVK